MRACLCVCISAVVVLGTPSNWKTGEDLGCSRDADCRGVGWICRQHMCDCGDGYVKQDAACINATVTVGLGGKCSANHECAMTQTRQATRCLNGICRCVPGYKPSGDNEDCIPQVQLGGKCNQSEDCGNTIINQRTECWRGVCSCGAGYKATAGKEGCVKVVIGDKCTEDRQCEATNSTRRCYRNVCTCSPPYIPSRQRMNTCLTVAKYHEYCEEDHQCLTANTWCGAPKCRCKEGYTWREPECVNCQAKLSTKLWLAAVSFVLSLKWLQ